MKVTLFILGSIILSTVSSLPAKKRNLIALGPQCFEMKSDFCRDVSGYPMSMKTTTSISDRALTEETLLGFQPLIDSGCAAELKQFLCFAHYPLCVNLPDPRQPSNHEIKPCRTSCKEVRAKCEPFLVAAGIEWPESLVCDSYPTDTCISVPVPNSVETPKIKCEECEVHGKSKALEEICDKNSRKMFAVVRVLGKKVAGDRKSLLYHVRIEHILKADNTFGVKSSDTLWVITSSTEDCDCHKLKPKESYILGIDVQSYHGAKLYMVSNDATVMKWKDMKDLSSLVGGCKDALGKH